MVKYISTQFGALITWLKSGFLPLKKPVIKICESRIFTWIDGRRTLGGPVKLDFEDKCWGTVSHHKVAGIQTSILSVTRDFRCSNHRHIHRHNRFYVITGKIAVVQIDPDLGAGDASVVDVDFVYPGEYLDIPPGVWHRFEVIHSGHVVETYWTTDGTEVDINDIERLDEGGPIDSYSYRP